MKNRIGAMLLALPVTAGGLSLFAGRTEASANSAPAYWTGTDGSGIVAVYDGGDCPIEVLHETLTFRIPDLPLMSMEKYDSRVTAEYELYNPTEQDVTLTLFLPVGFRPDYYDVYQENGAALPGADAYSVTLTQDGKVRDADITFRHTYSGNHGGQFDSSNLPDSLPSDTLIEEKLYRPQQDVTRYSYTVTAPKDADSYTFCFIYDCNPSKTQVICESGVPGFTNDGRGIAYAYLSAGERREVTFYAVGEQLSSPDIQTKLCVGWGGYSEEAKGGWVSVLTEKTQNFFDFVEEFRPDEENEYGGVSQLDWYNAVVAMLTSRESGALFLSDDPPLLDYLMLWCEYSLTVPAGGTLTNTVTAPLYPGIEGTVPDYTYDYFLTPALYWADFGSITIRVVTPYYLSSSTLQFTEQNGVYIFTKDSLPMGDLSFTIRQSINTFVPYDPYDTITPTIVTALILLGVVLLTAVVIVIVAVHVQRRNRKFLAEQLGRGMAQEGHIDLFDSENDRKNNP